MLTEWHTNLASDPKLTVQQHMSMLCNIRTLLMQESGGALSPEDGLLISRAASSALGCRRWRNHCETLTMLSSILCQPGYHVHRLRSSLIAEHHSEAGL